MGPWDEVGDPGEGVNRAWGLGISIRISHIKIFFIFSLFFSEIETVEATLFNFQQIELKGSKIDSKININTKINGKKHFYYIDYVIVLNTFFQSSQKSNYIL